ncbi:MAG: phospholipid carrier-dependent glycosyltransferase [Christensenellaceae bacterium]|nr:phospholipid carrier-dependent glycosyltransferase [Christensenellaceae bacterium]
MYKQIKNKLLYVLLLLIILLPIATVFAQQNENLISNGSFENIGSNGLPEGFYTDAYNNQPGFTFYSVSEEHAHSGNKSVSVYNINPNDARFATTVSVKPNTVYLLEGYILAEGIPNEGKGANLSIEGVYSFTQSLYDTYGDWVKVEMYGKTGPKQRNITVFARVGGYSGESEGRAFFDDISLKEVEDVAGIANVETWYRAETKPATVNNDNDKAHTNIIVISAFVYMLFAIIAIKHMHSNEIGHENKKQSYVFVAGLIAAFALRVYLAITVPGYAVDIGCFSGWSNSMYSLGHANFYNDVSFCDYPPAYMNVLWLNGLIMNKFSLSRELSLLLIKFVPILTDILAAIVLYKLACKRFNNYIPTLVALLYAFNPMLLVTGAAWGQIDSVTTLLLLIVVMSVLSNKWQYAVPFFILSILTKPQGLVFAPVAIISVITEHRRLSKNESLKGEIPKFYKKLGLGFLYSIILAAIIVVPFSINQKDPLWLISKYTNTVGSYQHATVNTANIFYLLAANWVDQNNPINTYFVLGLIVAIFSVLMFIIINNLSKSKNNDDEKQPVKKPLTLKKLLVILGGFYIIALAVMLVVSPTYHSFSAINIIFTFLVVIALAFVQGNIKNIGFWLAFTMLSIYVSAVRMHERYIFVAIILFLFDFIYNKNYNSLYLAILTSIPAFINTAIVLDNSVVFGSARGHLEDSTLALNIIISVFNCLNLLFAYICIYKGVNGDILREKTVKCSTKRYYINALITEKPKVKFSKKDVLLMLSVMVVYSCFAFYGLGSTKAPQTAWIASNPGEEVVFELEDSKDFELLYYGGINYNGFDVSTSDDGIIWSSTYPAELKEGQIFRWKYLVKSNIDANGETNFSNTPLKLKAKYIKIIATNAGLNLNEIIIRDIDGDKHPYKIVNISSKNTGDFIPENSDINNLTDEQDTMPIEPGYLSGTYFDEIYHARTAYEHIHNIHPYETSHPPLGKLIMALGVLIFGMTPFGFRFMGVVMGILMLPALYMLSKQLFNSRKFAFSAMLLFALDLMHLTQTRIATIDSFPVFFIIVAYLGMAKYATLDFNATPFKKTLYPLLLSGVGFGLACASKWIGMYAGVGLAVIFFHACYRQIACGNYANKHYDELVSIAPEREAVINNAKNSFDRVFTTCLWCVLFFIIIPATIYYLSYIPYFKPSGGITLDKVIRAQQGMFNYHSTPNLGADHPYQSPWYEWPFLLKPMWYMVEYYEPAGYSSTIFCMGNPALYYVAAFAMVAVLLITANRLFSNKLIATEKRHSYIVPLFISIGFLSNYLPWVLVPRSMFIYHYFASVPFIILATMYIFSSFEKRYPQAKKAINIILIVFIIICAIMFVAFYPFASGVQTSNKWFDFVKQIFPHIKVWY